MAEVFWYMVLVLTVLILAAALMALDDVIDEWRRIRKEEKADVIDEWRRFRNEEKETK